MTWYVVDENLKPDIICIYLFIYLFNLKFTTFSCFTYHGSNNAESHTAADLLEDDHHDLWLSGEIVGGLDTLGWWWTFWRGVLNIINITSIGLVLMTFAVKEDRNILLNEHEYKRPTIKACFDTFGL